MNLYNSLTKQIEPFQPLLDDAVRMYSCGPTVYSNLHIGNLAAFVYADVLRRTLAASGFRVQAVMNITDVDDKTIRNSREEFATLEPMAALQSLTSKYEKVFLDDTTRIGNDTASITFVRATETIADMQALTQQLLDANIAYPADDGIYFSIKNYELAGFTYGKLQQISRAHEQARIANDEYDKDSASDFALWKRAEAGEPSWPATFHYNAQSIEIPGRPGWHIECSAMSQKLLGIPFDIHTGGIDLKFPHHENEIAQSSAASGQHELARYFFHNNHVLTNGKKMSKSLGNVYTLRDVEAKGFDPRAFRLLVLSSHYRSESNFSWEILEAAQNRLKNWQAVADMTWQRPAASEQDTTPLIAALQNDLDTPAALALIDKLFDTCAQANLAPPDSLLSSIESLLGVVVAGPNITHEQHKAITAREAARAQKDWATSDRIRDELTVQGIGLRDTADGAIWFRL